MSKNIDDIYKKQDDLLKNNDKISKDIIALKKDIAYIKKQIKNIDNKVNLVLEILNNFTLMLMDENQDTNENYNNNDEWVPEQNEEWNSYEDDDIDG